MNYYPKTNMICFESFEIEALFSKPRKAWLREEIIKKGYVSEDLMRDEAKMHEVVNAVKSLRDKEDVEIFSALYVFPNFYSKESKICFLLKEGADPRKEPIDSLEKLKISIKENDLADFGLLTDDGLRFFQLKIYNKETNSDKLFDFLKEKLLHYGNNLHEVNLLVILQSKGDLKGNFFQNIYEKLKTLNLKGGGHILITYNEANKFDVMNTVYPILGTTRIVHKNFHG